MNASSQSRADPIAQIFSTQWTTVNKISNPVLARCDNWAGRHAAISTSTVKYEKYEGYRHALFVFSTVVQFGGV